jgi:hypothetical protein
MKNLIASLLCFFATAGFAAVNALPGAAEQSAVVGQPFPNPI